MFSQVGEYYSTTPTSGLFHDSGPAPVREEAGYAYASRVWFVTNEEAMCFHWAEDESERPQLDTYGGSMEPSDGDSYAACAVRHLESQVVLPESWNESLRRAILLDPSGQACVKIQFQEHGPKPRTAIWFVRLTEEEAVHSPTLTLSRGTEVRPGSMRWRPHGEILSNLSTYDRWLHALSTAMKKWLVPLSSPLP